MPENRQKFLTNGEKRKILVAEDEEINRSLLCFALEAQFEVLTASDGGEAMDAVYAGRDSLSLVLLDLNMPVKGGIEILRAMKEDAALRNIPVIVMTADRQAEVSCLELGAVDFIPKPYPLPEVILARVNRTIELFEDRQLIGATERDPLTGLFNKEYFFRYVDQFDQHHTETEMDAIVLDVDRFHILNDRFGVSYGDQVLRIIGEKLKAAMIACGGLACRLEADTFLIYCPHETAKEETPEKIMEDLTKELDDNNLVRLRMGLYVNADKSIDARRRFDRAKMAANAVRGNLMRNVGVYDETMREKEWQAEKLVEEFPDALAEEQFKVFYQPKFNVLGEKPVLASAEALVRWIHPEQGMISPGVFIPVFEENGLIQKLDHYVWRSAARQVRAWKDQLGISVPVSVNVSRVDLYDPALRETLSGILKEFDLSAADILLEITESAYTEEPDQIIQTVNGLRACDFSIEMDDFGTGYSSLNMLSDLPIDALKLDMSFIRNAFKEGKDTGMLEIIIGMAGYLGVPVIAEGVETEEQMKTLKELGCDIVQGYYFSKPVPAPEFEAFLREKKEGR